MVEHIYLQDTLGIADPDAVKKQLYKLHNGENSDEEPTSVFAFPLDSGRAAQATKYNDMSYLGPKN